METFEIAYSIWNSEIQVCTNWPTGTNSIMVQILELCFKSLKIVTFMFMCGDSP